MPHWLEHALNAYVWIAAVGFPLCLPWALQNAQDMKANYRIGVENGEAQAEDDLLLRARNFFLLIVHGDDKHRAWLREQFNFYWDLELTEVDGTCDVQHTHNTREKP